MAGNLVPLSTVPQKHVVAFADGTRALVRNNCPDHRLSVVWWPHDRRFDNMKGYIWDKDDPIVEDLGPGYMRAVLMLESEGGK